MCPFNTAAFPDRFSCSLSLSLKIVCHEITQSFSSLCDLVHCLLYIVVNACIYLVEMLSQVHITIRSLSIAWIGHMFFKRKFYFYTTG
uniref:Uncharacterized protein n=1 Tax=Arundo donax TaxID=35708 RepID=A0A0A9EQ79_ARUDO